MKSTQVNGAIDIVVVGANGKMGKALTEGLLPTTENAEGAEGEVELRLHRLVVAEQHANAYSAQRPNKLPPEISVCSELQGIEADLVIDFTRPEATIAYLRWCVDTQTAMVIGTTGFSEQQLAEIETASLSIPIVLATNMSVGVNLCFYLLEKAAQVMGDVADIEILETHHRNKVDSPSGTALSMGKIIAKSLGRDFAEVAQLSREGDTGVRSRKTIGFASSRAGDVVGDHTVLFASEGERLEITHKASDRSIYVQGALRAARWLVGKNPGLYDMQDVLQLRD